MSKLKKHSITIRYIAIDRPNIASVYPANEVAEQLFHDWPDGRWGAVPEILNITVDGEVFTSIEETRK